MALSDERIDDLAQNYGLDWLDYEPFARSIEAEVRKQDEALIRQMLDALENGPDYNAAAWSAIQAARARLES